MPDIYESFTEQEATSRVLDTYRLTTFAYDDTAFNKPEGEDGRNAVGSDIYDYNAHNNIPQTTGLSTSTQTLGLGERSGVFKRSFWNHYAGRISYNLNKAVQALKAALGSFRADYSENISEYSEYAAYAVGDVCYRLNDDEIIFYRCIAAIAAPAGDFNGVYWEKPEEELAYNRPAVGVPVLWFEKVPDWAIRFDDGSRHKWTDVPALNFQEFKDTLLGLEDFGAALTADGFRVAKFFDDDPEKNGYVPMFEGGDNEVRAGYSGDDFTACVQEHTHGAPALTIKLSSTSISHTHDDATSTTAGNHSHPISSRCNYDGTGNRNTTRIPVDAVNSYNPATLTNYGGSHSHPDITDGAGIADHYHTVTVTGRTGAVKEATGGNPDGFQSCWIVRYK